MIRLLAICIFLLCGMAAAKDVGALVVNLRTGDTNARAAAKHELIAKGKSSIDALHAVYYPDLDALLKGLGADSHRVREGATSSLIAIGEPCRKKVEALLKSSDDPEVTLRCKRVLATIKQITGDGNLNDALEIVLAIGEKTPTARPFVKHYFANYTSLELGHKAQLPKAVALCEEPKALEMVLLQVETEVNAQILLKEIKARMPKDAPIIIADFEQKQLERAIKLAPYLKKLDDRRQGELYLDDWGERDEATLETVAKTIEAEPLFEKKRPILVSKLLMHEWLDAKMLGIRLAKKAHKGDNALILKAFGEICAGSNARIIAEMLLKRFPALRTDLQDIVVRRILKTPIKEARAIRTLASVLKTPLGYSRHGLDDWYVKFRAEARDGYGWEGTIAMQVNVSGHVYLPLTRKSGGIGQDKVRYILRTTPKEHLKTVLKHFKEHIEDIGPHNCSTFVILEKMPEWHGDLLEATYAYWKKDKEFFCHYRNEMKYYAEHLSKTPAFVARVRIFLSDHDPYTRLYAASVILSGLPSDKSARSTLLALARDHLQNPDVCEAILTEFFMHGFDFSEIEAPLKAHISRLTEKSESLSFVTLSPRFKDQLPFFRNLFSNQVAAGHARIAQDLAFEILHVDPDERLVLDYLRERVRTGPTEEAARLLGKLGAFRRDPKLTIARIEQLYTGCKTMDTINSALAASANNRKKALPIVKKHLKRNLKEFNGLGDLLWKNEEYQRALTPGLVDALTRGPSKASKVALEVLASGSCALKHHMNALKTYYSRTTDEKLRHSFLWMLANMETDAAPFASILPKRYGDSSGEDKSHFLFAMSRISPNKVKRKEYTQAFIAHLKTIPDEKKPYRMLRLIDEFPELSFPIFGKMIKENNEMKNRYEAVWALIKEKPFSPETIASFELLLKRCQRGTPGHDEIAMNLCWALRERLPDAVQLIPLLKNANSRLKAEEGYRLLMHDLREYQRKQPAKTP